MWISVIIAGLKHLRWTSNVSFSKGNGKENSKSLLMGPDCKTLGVNYQSKSDSITIHIVVSPRIILAQNGLERKIHNGLLAEWVFPSPETKFVLTERATKASMAHIWFISGHPTQADNPADAESSRPSKTTSSVYRRTRVNDRFALTKQSSEIERKEREKTWLNAFGSQQKYNGCYCKRLQSQLTDLTRALIESGFWPAGIPINDLLIVQFQDCSWVSGCVIGLFKSLWAWCTQVANSLSWYILLLSFISSRNST